MDQTLGVHEQLDLFEIDLDPFDKDLVLAQVACCCSWAHPSSSSGSLNIVHTGGWDDNQVGLSHTDGSCDGPNCHPRSSLVNDSRESCSSHTFDLSASAGEFDA